MDLTNPQIIMRDKEIAQLRAELAAVLEAQGTDQRLINLLCRIHRDGGHYIAEHGLDKAVEDADIRVAEQNAAFDVQSKQEPVAWVYYPKGVGEKYVTYTNPASLNLGKQAGRIAYIQPLYAAPVVRPDMVMVPREATPEMVSAGYSKITMEIENSSRDISDVYRAMIAAAEGKK